MSYNSIAATVGWSQMPRLPALWSVSTNSSNACSGLSGTANAVLAIPEMETWVAQRYEEENDKNESDYA